MMRNMPVVRALSAAIPAAMLSLLLSGCGSGAKEPPKPIDVVNPDPNPSGPLKGVTLENEAQNVDRLRAMHNTPNR
jgi:hypothetical protein